VDASDVSYSSIGEVSEGQPVCMLGLRLHILVAGATFNLSSRPEELCTTLRCIHRI
jgi:cyanophycinase